MPKAPANTWERDLPVIALALVALLAIPLPLAALPLAALPVATLSVAAAPPSSVQTRQVAWTDAYQAYADGDYRRAEELFRALIASHPGWAYPRYMLALTLQRLGRSDEALDEMRRGEGLVDDMEGRLLARRSLAEIRLQRGEYDEAIRAAQEAQQFAATIERRALGTRPEELQLSGGTEAQRVALEGILGRAFLQQGRWQQAAVHLERLTEMRAADGRAHALLGRVRYELGDAPRALESLERALQIDPDDTVALRFVGRLHEDEGRLLEALEAYERLARLEPSEQVEATLTRLRRALGEPVPEQAAGAGAAAGGGAAADAAGDPSTGGRGATASEAPESAGWTLEGTGTRSTQPFEMQGPWEIQWTCSAAIRITLYSGAGEQIVVAAEQQTQGAGSTFYPEGGRFYLRIESPGDWRLRVRPQLR